MITPKRRFWARGREAASMPATPNASVAAAIASGSTRETCLRSRRSTHASSSKSATSPAICTEISDASKREMRRTPLRPSSTACEKDGLPTPLGLTTPMPVITTRRCTRTSISLEYTSIARRALCNCLQNVILQNQQRCSEPLASRPTSINKDRLSCYERSCRRSQKYHRSSHVHRFADTVQRRDSFQYINAILRHGKILFGSRRANEGRRHGINRDSVLSPFDCQTLRQMGDGRFGHAVHRFTRQRGESRLRTHIDNSPMLLANHHSPRRLAGKKRSLQIHCQGCIKVLLADVFRQILRSNPGIVHQDVQLSEPGRCFIHPAENLLHVGDIHLQRQGPSPQAFNFADQFASRRNIAKPEGHICSRMRQGQRNCASQPASRSGHQCHLPLQIKSWEVIHAGRLYNSSLLRTENRDLKFNRKF